MPKRIGYLYDKVISLENCVQAERMMAKNKPDNRMARHIGDNAERYGAELSKMLREDRWTPEPNREFDLVDGYKQKTRHLKVPCLLDQSVQYAWMNIATPEIEKRNYYYNCGSIPGAGQTRSVRALQKWLGVKKPPRYGGICDIRHFYDTCPHEVVMKGLRRRMRKAAGNLTAKAAAGVMSYLGILKHCDSYNFRVKYVHPFINIDQCKEVIRNAQKIKNRIRGEAGSLPGGAHRGDRSDTAPA